MNQLEESENPSVQKLNRRRHLGEVGVLLFLTLLLCGLFALHDSLLRMWSALCSISAVVSFFLAVRACDAAIKVYRTAPYRITERRLSTLRAVGVPDDATRCLKESGREDFKNEHDLLAYLEKALGRERTREVKSTSFRYTKV
jgi:hypothetical protein